MGNAVSTPRRVAHHRHPASWLVIASMTAIGLSGTVAIVAAGGDRKVVPSSAEPLAAMTANGDIRYDGGPEEGSRGPLFLGSTGGAQAAVRYDGGPEEGSRVIVTGR